jgi:parafibromin
VGGAALANTQMGNGGGVGGHMMQSQTALLAQKRSLAYNRFDQERYGPKDETGGFSIDTKLTYQPNGGTISLTPAHNNPSTTPAHNLADKSNKNLPIHTSSSSSSSNNNNAQSQLTQQKTNILPRLTSPHSLNQAQKTRKSPIIIIPNITSSLITMMNALDILQDLKYVSTEDKRKTQQTTNQNAPKECQIITRKREDGKNQQFKIVDNINKMLPQDWDRVVAVFAQGPQWQFKGWPFGTTNPPNPVEIFSKVKGFHLKMYGNPVDPNISKWSVTVVELDPHKRHLDRARLLSLWDELDRFIVKNKPYLSG